MSDANNQHQGVPAMPDEITVSDEAEAFTYAPAAVAIAEQFLTAPGITTSPFGPCSVSARSDVDHETWMARVEALNGLNVSVDTPDGKVWLRPATGSASIHHSGEHLPTAKIQRPSEPFRPDLVVAKVAGADVYLAEQHAAGLVVALAEALADLATVQADDQEQDAEPNSGIVVALREAAAAWGRVASLASLAPADIPEAVF